MDAEGGVGDFDQDIDDDFGFDDELNLDFKRHALGQGMHCMQLLKGYLGNTRRSET